MGTIGPFGPETICILDRQCYLRIDDRAGIQIAALDSRVRGNDGVDDAPADMLRQRLDSRRRGKNGSPKTGLDIALAAD
jgi:hypothetical protein